MDTANRCVVHHRRLERRYKIWRLTLIFVTGGLAILNTIGVFLAGSDFGENTAGPTIFGFVLDPTSYALLLAVIATIAAVLSNLEAFGKNLERSQAFREASAMLLVGAQRARALWNTRVVPFADDPQACLNACQLLEWLQARDAVLREHVNQITNIYGREGPPK